MWLPTALYLNYKKINLDISSLCATVHLEKTKLIMYMPIVIFVFCCFVFVWGFILWGDCS